ncbi:MAG: putative membrane protein [Candidatus Azotimanducaceae bacterium]|jgi:putative membrane protein|tara:strand:- start:1285 stop:1698 length:414 start_codon:yes stop_codon:yes gene_type:complete
MLWIKVIHVLFVMAWMAGVFYLPRILVHAAEGQTAGEDTRRLIIMADKLVRFSTVMMILALIPGFVLWLHYGFSGQWLYWKLAFVAGLCGYQWQSFRYAAQLKRGQIIRSSLFFRLYNEGALLLLTPILILVIVKPL